MKLIAKTLYGLEGVLAGELSSLGVNKLTEANRAVLFSGDQATLYKVNYMSRTAISVLWQISAFSIGNADHLYRKSLEIEWDNYMDNSNTFAVVPVVQSRLFNHTGYAALKLKDSVADYFRKKTGSRPSVDTENPDIIINLHISNDKVTVSLDSSGEPLFRRGYRTAAVAAPLNESLAAGMILISGWKSGMDLIDPMCGSGTIPIEAALVACRIPPGKFRRSFGFMKWKNYDSALFGRVKESAEGLVKSPENLRIAGSDISEEAIRKSALNAAKAGVGKVVSFSQSDIMSLKPERGSGMVFINPPYGERLSQGETDALYGIIGTSLKHNFTGYEAWILSSNRESMKFIGLKPSARHILYNGALECQYWRFELYSGSRKENKG
jgi:putative N6-adenine-specific DNA methylase